MRARRAPDCPHCRAAAIAAASSAAWRQNVPRGSSARTAAGSTEPPSSAAAGACIVPPAARTLHPTTCGGDPSGWVCTTSAEAGSRHPRRPPSCASAQRLATGRCPRTPRAATASPLCANRFQVALTDAAHAVLVVNYKKMQLTRNTIELYPTIFKNVNRNRWRLVLNLIILNISTHWLKIKKLLKKYDCEIAVNLIWTSLKSAIETTHWMVFSNRMRCLDRL